MKKFLYLVICFLGLQTLHVNASIDDLANLFNGEKAAAIKTDWADSKKIDLDEYGALPEDFWPQLERIAREVEELHLQDCKLQGTPDVSIFKNLRKLNLASNALTKTPDVSTLTHLEHLDLEDNQLTVTPDIAALTKLKVLALGLNHLTVLPNLSNCPDLEMLDLSENRFEAAPDVSGLTLTSFHFEPQQAR